LSTSQTRTSNLLGEKRDRENPSPRIVIENGIATEILRLIKD